MPDMINKDKLPTLLLPLFKPLWKKNNWKNWKKISNWNSPNSFKEIVTNKTLKMPKKVKVKLNKSKKILKKELTWDLLTKDSNLTTVLTSNNTTELTQNPL